MGRDDRRRHAGHFRPVVDRRRPGAVILIASLAFNLLGDGLRDVLEPQHD
jgi:hypothetical protein